VAFADTTGVSLLLHLAHMDPQPAVQPVSARSGRKVLLWMLGVFLAAVVPAIVLPTVVCRPKAIELDDYGEIPAFTLRDETGHEFTQEALRGHVTLVNFIFTRCESICPVTSMKMQKLQEKTSMAGDTIKLVSFSVDPTYDTPERLAAYAKRFAADPARWRFVTGPFASVQALVTGPMMQSMQQNGVTASGAPDIAHNGHFVLVDTQLHIRGLYDSAEVTRLDAMVHHARYLARTASSR
jgi:protein SCO1/2